MNRKNGNFGDRKLFIGGIPASLTNAMIHRFFSKFGKVEDCLIAQHPNGQSRGWGVITFSKPDEATRALASKTDTIEGRYVDIKKYEPQNAFRRSNSTNSSNSNYSLAKSDSNKSVFFGDTSSKVRPEFQRKDETKLSNGQKDDDDDQQNSKNNPPDDLNNNTMLSQIFPPLPEGWVIKKPEKFRGKITVTSRPSFPQSGEKLEFVYYDE